MNKKKRTSIPRSVSHKIKVEAGHQCAVWRCQQMAHLERHHIDGNPNNHNENNVILLCRQHHVLADRGEITPFELTMYKQKLKDMLVPHADSGGLPPEVMKVDLNYPHDSGLQDEYERQGYTLRWSSEDKLARRLEINGWQYAYKSLFDGRKTILKSPRGELTLIAKKIETQEKNA